MKNSVAGSIVHISLFLGVISLSACTDDLGDEASIAEDESALSGGPWTWQNIATSRCLDSNTGGSVYAIACNGGDYQLWTNTPFNLGDQIRDKATGLCLDSNNSGRVYTLACNGGAFQQWVVRNTSAGYEIRNVATGLCLDSNANGSVYTHGCNGGNFQRWR